MRDLSLDRGITNGEEVYALSASAGRATAARVRGGGEGMQRWEYAYIMGHEATDRYALYFLTGAGLQKHGIARDRTAGDDSNFDACVRTIAYLGSIGWEMIAVAEWGEGQRLYFKRRTESA
jgi:hypothetical protein